jgi:predicted transcriptional regulator
MQILIDDAEYRRIQRIARKRGMTVAEWVRQALRRVYRREPLGDADRKIASVRAASSHEFPTAEIDRMLAEIERGYLGADAR